MLAVDELALRVAKNDSATAFSRHDPVLPMEWRSPGSVTDVHPGRWAELPTAVGEDGQHLGHHPVPG
jgi:hypothetical protein